MKFILAYFTFLFFSFSAWAAAPEAQTTNGIAAQTTNGPAAQTTNSSAAKPAGTAPETTNSVKHVILGILDRQKKADFESKVLPILKAELDLCQICEIHNYTPYDENGNFQADRLESQLQTIGPEVSVLLVNFNDKINTHNRMLVDRFVKISSSGVVLVVSAGQPQANESSAPLSQTIFGQVPNALIIGELGEKDRLLGASHFGPEMLTAIRPPKELIGQGFSPALFAAKLTRSYPKKSDWVNFLRGKKVASRKIWLDFTDCFGR